MDGYSLSMTGTGFFVTKDGYLLTPNHVAGWCQRRAVLRPEGAYEATVVAQNEKADIAVLKSSAPHGVASLAPTRLMPRDTPFVIVRYYHLGGMGSRSAVFASYLGFVPLGSVDVAVRAAQDVVGGKQRQSGRQTGRRCRRDDRGGREAESAHRFGDQFRDAGPCA